MTPIVPTDVWAVANAYEQYVGRWSRSVASAFLAWLGMPAGLRWLDVGCGTGALSESILGLADPARVVGIDASFPFVNYTNRRVTDRRITLMAGDAEHLPVATDSHDCIVSGLMLNFVPNPHAAIAEMARVSCHDGLVAVYVWDYAEDMQLMRYFWDSAAALDAAALDLDEGRRFSMCRPDALEKLVHEAGLEHAQSSPLDVPTVFKNFEDYWSPFLGGQGPAPGYAMSLSEERRTSLRERIRARLPMNADGSIELMARAWGVRGRKPSNSHRHERVQLKK